MVILDRHNLVRPLVRRADRLAELRGGVVAGLEDDGWGLALIFARVFRAGVTFFLEMNESAGFTNVGFGGGRGGWFVWIEKTYVNSKGGVPVNSNIISTSPPSWISTVDSLPRLIFTLGIG